GDVVAFLVGQRAGQLDDRLHAEGGGGDVRDQLGDRVVLPDRTATLLALVGPVADDAHARFGGREVGGGEAQAAGVECDQRDLEPVTLLPDHVLLGYAYVVKLEHRVLDAAQAHERVAAHDLEAAPIALHHEGRDAAAVTLSLRHHRHHHQ